MPEPSAAPAAPYAAGSPHGTAPFLAKAPPLWIPMRHFVAAAAAFWIFAAAFAWGNGRFLDWDFKAFWVLGLVHTLTLGWVTMTIFGAMSQLAPVLWETPLAAPKLVKAAWWLFIIGIIGFVGHLWAGLQNYWMPALSLVAAVGLYLYSFVRTMASASKLDWTGKHLALSVCYLCALAVLGLLLAYDREGGLIFSDSRGALIAHVHLALIGWVSLSIIGVSYRLVSMFALSHLESKRAGRITLALANAGLVGLAIDSLFFTRRFLPLWACLLAAAYLAYVFQMRQIFDARNRKLDPALSFTLLALAGGAVWVGLGVALAFGWLPDSMEARSAYIFAALIGWITPFILGQIHKIVPFLIWLHVYSTKWKPGKPLPKIQDLTSAKLAWIELGSLAPSIVMGTAGFLLRSQMLLRASSWLMLVCASLYLLNTGLTLSHLARREPQWTL